MVDSPLRFSFRAIEDTVVKARPKLGSKLPGSQKWFVKAGTMLHGTSALLEGRHIRVEGATIDGGEARAETARFVYFPHWQICGTEIPNLPGPRPFVAQPVHPPSLVVSWVPTLTETADHFIHYVAGNDTLVVTFDHFGARGQNIPWGGKFILGSGWSFLGITSKTDNWFREPELHSIIGDYAARGLFRMFRRVVFAGPSMGGFGAGAFSSLAPGCTVVTMSPQSTMSRRLVPWERRFSVARRLDWSGKFADAAAEVRGAAQVIIAFDPRMEPDRLHAERFPAHNRLLLPAPHLGHKIATAFQEMKILKPFMQACIEGQMDLGRFQALMRRRRHARVYFKSLLDQARRSGRLQTIAYLSVKQAEWAHLSSPGAAPPRIPAGRPHSAG